MQRACHCCTTRQPAPRFNKASVFLQHDMAAVKQHNKPQFTSLYKALCKCIYELNASGRCSTLEVIACKLRQVFPNMEIPNFSILHRAISVLTVEGKLRELNGEYFVCQKETSESNDNEVSDEINFSCSSPETQILLENKRPLSSLHESSSSSVTESTYRLGVINRENDVSLLPILNSSSESTKHESNSDNSDITAVSSLRRSASLKLNSEKNRRDEKLFKRSRSLRLRRKKHDIAENLKLHDDSSCKSAEEPQKKLSMLGKLLRFRGGNSHGKAKAANSANFSSQFPESNSDEATTSVSKATQTVQCGLDEMNLALIIRQAKKHVLVNNNNKHRQCYCNSNKFRHCCGCSACDFFESSLDETTMTTMNVSKAKQSLQCALDETNSALIRQAEKHALVNNNKHLQSPCNKYRHCCCPSPYDSLKTTKDNSRCSTLMRTRVRIKVVEPLNVASKIQQDLSDNVTSSITNFDSLQTEF